jgi:hypothetical protein
VESYSSISEVGRDKFFQNWQVRSSAQGGKLMGHNQIHADDVAGEIVIFLAAIAACVLVGAGVILLAQFLLGFGDELRDNLAVGGIIVLAAIFGGWLVHQVSNAS